MNNIIDILCDPNTSGDLIKEDDNLIDMKSKQVYKINKIIDLRPAHALQNSIISDYKEHYEKDAEVFDHFNEDFGEDALEDFRRLRQYIFSLIPKNSKRILDAGSGGAWLAKMIGDSEKEIISFDISPINVRKAVESLPYKNHFGVVGDALQPPFKEGSFDCIVSSEVIEHLPYPDLFIQKMLKLLKNNGTLIVSTPYKEKIKYETCIHCNAHTPRNAHLHSFDEYKMKEMANSDFTQYDYKTFGNKALIFSQFHKISKYFNFEFWKFTDNIANNIINKQAHIISIYKK